MSLSLAHSCRVGALALCFQSSVLADSLVTTQSVSVVLSPLGKVTVPASISLLSGSLAFSAYTAALPVLFRARTNATGSGTITVQAAADFAPSGGPSVTTGMLTYTCAAAAYGTACAGTQTVSTTSQRPVITLPPSACTGGGNGCSSADPASIDLLFRLENDVSIPTGNYSVQLTFTVSST
jgi:hypothetical protein